MANSISFGSAPVFEGTIVAENTAYIGNNRFLRVVSQTSPDALIAVMYEFQDILNDTTPTIVCEEVLQPSVSYSYIALTILGDGRFVIRTKDLSYVRSFHYDEQSNTFVDHANETEVVNGSACLFAPVGNDSIVYASFETGGGWGYDRVEQIKFNPDNTTTKTQLHYNYSITKSLYYLSEQYGSSIGTDNLFLFTLTSANSPYNKIYKADINDVENGFDRVLPNGGMVGKINDEKQLLLNRGPSGEWRYDLYGDQYPDVVESTFFPVIPHYYDSATSYVAIDEYYGMLFKQVNSTVTFNIVKIVDAEHGFVSTNSSAGDGVEVTASFNTGLLGKLPGNKFASKISNDTFCVQTDFTSFVVFKVIPS